MTRLICDRCNKPVEEAYNYSIHTKNINNTIGVKYNISLKEVDLCFDCAMFVREQLEKYLLVPPKMTIKEK